MKSRMHFPALTLLVALFAASAVIYGDTYPNKPIRMIVPYSPGGTGDNIARAVGGELAKLLGQQIINDNRPGAGGNIGADIVAKAEPDGYTLVMAATSLASNPSLQKKMSFDPLKDLTPVSQCCEVPMIVVVHPSLPIKSIKDLIAYAKANPGNSVFPRPESAASHLAAELFKVLAKVDMVHVPYKADAQALPDLLAGQVNLMFMFQTSALPQIKADKLRPLAVSTRKRSPLLPDLPTVGEARAGTPKERIEKLSAANIKALQTPELKERLLKQGAIPIATTPEQFTAFFRGEVEKWARVVKEGGLELID
jgi:tripartite-type tricarboxylate transporter receptor subunit TctC